MRRSRHQTGFTLIELVMVIVILGAVGSMASVFMKGPIDAYFASARRAALTDVADTTVRRMARDIRKALPNSIRLVGTQCIEFIPTRTGGRYREQDATPGDGTSLGFTAPDLSFNMLGGNSLLVNQQIIANDVVAVYNLGISGADVYAGDNTAVISSVVDGTEMQINMASNTTKFPLPSGSNRFHVIPGNEKIVSFICSGGKLYRNANYAYSSSCPAPTSATPLIANGATCNFSYDPQDIRNALVQLKMVFSSAGEAVNIYHEVHVNNTP
jgi:MSHA biogenesis protein MshO